CRSPPVRFWVSRATASAVNTTGRWASIASRVWWKIGRARRSVFDIRKDCSTCQVEVLRDDLGGRHRRGVDAGDVALQPDRAPSSRERGLVQGALAVGVLDEPRGLGLLLS